MAKDESNQTLEEWWLEDAERLNDFCESCEDAGITVGSVHEPPELNPDGSLKKQ